MGVTGKCIALVACYSLISVVTSATHDHLPAERPIVSRGTPLVDLFDDEQAYFQVETPAGPKKYQYIWLTTESKQLRLRIKGKQGAHIALARTPHVTATDAYELLIGGYDPPQQKFEIRKNVAGGAVRSADMDNILSQTEFRSFWISWEGGKIAIGLGSEVGEQEKVSWADPDPLSVTAVSMDTNNPSDLAWQFLRSAARDLFVWSAGGNSHSDIWFTQPVKKYFTFGARGCRQAKIGLSAGMGLGAVNESMTYVVFLGGGTTGDESLIKRTLGGDESARVSTPGILSCSDRRYFWVSWESGYIQVGKGLRVGDNMFLNWLPDNPHEIKSVTPFFGANAGPNPEFHFRNVEENYYLLKSSNIFDFNKANEINIEQRTSFVFRVHACYEAVLVLRRKYAGATSGAPPFIQIILGTQESQGDQTFIDFVLENGESDGAGFLIDSPGILSCHNFKHLWIGWQDAMIRVGSGDIPYQNEILSFGDPFQPFSVDVLQLGSLTEDYDVEWQFSRSQAKATTLITSPFWAAESVWLTSAERSDLYFKVKGASPVQLVLTTYVGNMEISMYTVRISNRPLDTGIWREDDKPHGKFVGARNLLDADHFTALWVSWTGSSVTLGRGVDLGRDVTVTFKDTASSGPLEINAVAFTSEWESFLEIGDEEGPGYTVYTSSQTNNPTYNSFWMTPSAYIFPFKVMAEEQCYIALTKIAGNSGDGSIEIKIDINTTDITLKGSDQTARSTSPGILNINELRPMWVSWFNRTVQIGQGLPLQGVLSSLSLSEEIVVRGIGLASGATKAAEWTFNREMATEMRMATRNEYKYDQLWLDVGQTTSQVFRVRAKSDANILLATTSEVTKTSVYEITLGVGDNTQTVIRSGTHTFTDHIEATQDTPGILSEDEMRTFWVAWSNSEVGVGSGPEVGQNVIVSWIVDNLHPVHALSVATEPAGEGFWELYRLKGEVYHTTTFPSMPFGPVMTTQNDHISFSIYGCSPASVDLLEGQDTENVPNDLYQVVLGSNNDSHVAIYKVVSLQWTLLKDGIYTDLIKCGLKTDLWAGWKDNLIQVGRGVFPHNIILEVSDTVAPHPVNAFAFSNNVDPAAENYAIQWEIDKGAVHSLIYMTMGPKAYHHGTWMSVYKQDFHSFTMKTCGVASIALSQQVSVFSYQAYQIEIDVAPMRNIYTIYKGTTSVKTKTSPTVFDCERSAQDYWIGWRNGTIEIGHGTIAGGTAQVNYIDTIPHDVNFLAFASSSHTVWSIQSIQAGLPIEVFFNGFNGTIEIGHGTIAGGTAQVNYIDTVPHDVNFLAFASSSHTVWSIQSIQGDEYVHTTRQADGPAAPRYTDLRMFPLRHVQAVSFAVTGCSNARIALSEDGNSLDSAYEISIEEPTADGYHQTSIRKSVNGVCEAIYSVSGLIDCDHQRRLWVSWDNNRIRLGEGNIGSFTLLQWHIPIGSRHSVHAVGFGAGGNDTIRWNLPTADAEAVHGRTPAAPKDKERFWQSVSGRNTLVFQVKTCERLSIFLTSMLYETRSETHRITTGGDDDYARIVNVDEDMIIAASPYPGLVNCTEYRTFWLRWSDKIQFGKGGYVGKGLLLQGQDYYEYPINSIGFDGMTKEAHWTFLRAQGEVFRTYTSDDLNYDAASLKLDRRQNLTFSLRACANAYVRMVSSTNWYKNSIEIIIGSYGNSKVELRHAQVEEPEVIVDADGILSCDELRRFWISWEHGQIRFGKGDLGETEVLYWHFQEDGGPPMPFSLEMIQVATLGNTGEWELEQTSTLGDCSDKFKMVAAKADGFRTTCRIIAIVFSDLQTCYPYACEYGASVIGYDDEECYLHRCTDPDDPQLGPSENPNDVYLLDVPKDTFIAKTRKSLTANYDQHWVSVSEYTSISFKVKACAEVHLALAAVPAISDILSYEVVIGGSGNTHSSIHVLAGSGGDPAVRLPTPGVLMCDSSQHLWVSWERGLIVAGKGLVVGQEPFIEWQSGKPNIVINAVGISNSLETQGTYTFGNIYDEIDPPFSVEDEDYIMRTDGGGRYDTHRWSISRSYLLFQMQACSSAEIVLTVIPGSYTDKAYIVKLGSKSNTETSISEVLNEQVSQSSQTVGVLNCSEARPFWLEWSQTVIAIGEGSARGLNPLVQLTNPSIPKKFNEIAVATKDSQEGYWTVRKSEGHVFKFATPVSEKYQEVWRSTRSQNYIVFKVKACNDAHILLSRHMDSLQDVYEVALGIHSNQYSVIRKCQQCNTVADSQNPGVLSCFALRSFWIRWYQGIEVGYGSVVGSLPMMRLHEEGSDPIQAMSVMTGWGSTGEWHFSDMDGEAFYLSPQPSPSFGHIWVSEQTNYFEFSVRSCESAYISMSSTPFSSQVNHPGYQVRLEGSVDKVSELLRFPLETGKSPVKDNATTPAIINCDAFSKIWISWGEGAIRVGYGALLEDPFLYYMDDQPLAVNALSLRTPSTQQSNSEWQFDRRQSKHVMFNTIDGRDFVDWLTVDEQKFTYLRITACRDVEILLSSSPGVTYGHKIILGKDNIKTVILSASTNEEVFSKNGSNPLQCPTGAWFWLSWADNKIAMGLGFESGSDVVAFYDMDNEREDPFEIGAIGFRTTVTVGTFEFSPAEGRDFEISTARGNGYQHVWLLTTRNVFTFKLKACGDSKIALTEDVIEGDDVTITNHYELIIGANDNHGYQLWKYNKDSQSASLINQKNMTGTIITCDTFTSFWLSWEVIQGKRSFKLGEGPDLYTFEVFNAEDVDTTFPITSIALASAHTRVAKWVFKHDAAALTRLHTDALFSYDKFQYHVSAVNTFVFKLKAARDAHIILMEHYHSDKAYEIIIGMSGNNYTAIREGSLTAPVASRVTVDVLSEHEYRQFWVSWSNQRVAVGRGNIPGRGEIVGHNSNTVPFIQYLSISTWNSVRGYWEYVPQTSNTLLVKTPEDSDHTNMLVSFGNGKFDFSFDVRACSEAQIRLLPDVNSDPKYELIIGADGNSKTKIYKDGVMVHSQTTLDVLHCLEKRYFWLGWKDGFFDLAKGSAAGQRILEWLDPNYTPVHSLTLATGRSQSGDWSLPRYQAQNARFVSYASRQDENVWMTVAEFKSYVFRVKASSSATILLTDVPGVLSRFAYEIQIGTDSNTMTKIRRLKSLEIIGSGPTPDILSSYEFRWFWISWGHYNEHWQGIIKLGNGLTPGFDEVMRGYAQDPIEVNGLGFSSSDNVNATWELLTNTEGNSYLLRTDGISYNDGAWVTPMDNILHFDVQACQDARVALLKDKNGTVGFELLLGGFDNTASALFSGLIANGGQLLMRNQGQGIVECGRLKRFWVSWVGNDIKVGEGYDDATPFITYRHTNLPEINVIGFSSDAVSQAEWRIPQEQETSLYLTTKSNGTYNQHWITIAGMDSVIFRVRECHTAKVALVAIPDDTFSLTEIVVGLDARTVIRDVNGVIKASANTPDILTCIAFTTFWIHWRHDRIYLGAGTRVYENTILRYEDVNLHEIASMGLATSATVDAPRGHWQIFGLRGNTIKASTPANKDYDLINILPENPNLFFTTFRARACDNAHFLIAPNVGTTNDEYEAVFGSYDNERFEIRKGGNSVASAMYLNVMSPTLFRSFWVNWHGGNITAGWGRLGQGHAVAYYDPNAVTMYRTGYSTWDNCPGDWDIDQRIGDTVQVHTKGTHVYDKVHIMMMDAYWFKFQVKASHSVHIALSVVPGMTRTETWEIGLQAVNRQTNFIRDKLSGTDYLAQTTRGGLLDDQQYKAFWISWNSGRVGVGQGENVGLLNIVSVNHDHIPHFSSVSFATALAVTADWQFTFGDRYSATTTTSTSTTTQTSTTKSTSQPTKQTTRTTTTASGGTGSTNSTTEIGPTEGIPDPGTGGLSGGEIAGIVIGVLLALVLILVIAFLMTLRYKPDTLPREVVGAVPTGVQRAVRRDPNTVPVHFTNPIFGGEDGLSQNKITYGTTDGEPLNDFNNSDT